MPRPVTRTNSVDNARVRSVARMRRWAPRERHVADTASGAAPSGEAARDIVGAMLASGPDIVKRRERASGTPLCVHPCPSSAVLRDAHHGQVAVLVAALAWPQSCDGSPQVRTGGMALGRI